ncbi:uncharacterized protein MONBRDRAFT_34214 [Monosiga brevicollis MX1]|uniref:Histone-lysine N-methyltransferase, H3 lysine-79 specific n=1 Tax=Monosiga brevicollis TaxID=81824 RepID=A9VA99_MONBE|nr:uncharacterized protein MONBRDRAFT_34214 [Monosiga brevicollis MX1]EDQ85503.1 predicted protein [Monosiga brevicollis MX1]|eukprot:XP_001749694.1 hypothetical protein [Monosiga brevicollis MX1]
MAASAEAEVSQSKPSPLKDQAGPVQPRPAGLTPGNPVQAVVEEAASPCASSPQAPSSAPNSHRRPVGGRIGRVHLGQPGRRVPDEEDVEAIPGGSRELGITEDWFDVPPLFPPVDTTQTHLAILSPNPKGPPMLYQWPFTHMTDSSYDAGFELLNSMNHIVKLCALPVPDTWADDIVACAKPGTEFASLSKVVEAFNAAMRVYHKSVGEQAERLICPTDLCEHIMNMTYSRAVTDPALLNRYKGWTAEVYGEFTSKMISDVIANSNVQPDDTFVDLGSGVGQVVLQVALEGRARTSFGIEKQDIPAEYAKCGAYELVKDNFLQPQYAERITNTSVVFLNNFAFGTKVNQQLCRMFENCQAGTRLISSISLRKSDFTITARTLNDLGCILTMRKLCYRGQGVSWTARPFSYYVQTVNHQYLDQFFSKGEPVQVPFENEVGDDDDDANPDRTGTSHSGAPVRDNSDDEEDNDEEAEDQSAGAAGHHKTDAVGKGHSGAERDGKAAAGTRPGSTKRSKGASRRRDRQSSQQSSAPPSSSSGKVAAGDDSASQRLVRTLTRAVAGLERRYPSGRTLRAARHQLRALHQERSVLRQHRREYEQQLQQHNQTVAAALTQRRQQLNESLGLDSKTDTRLTAAAAGLLHTFVCRGGQSATSSAANAQQSVEHIRLWTKPLQQAQAVHERLIAALRMHGQAPVADALQRTPWALPRDLCASNEHSPTRATNGHVPVQEASAGKAGPTGPHQSARRSSDQNGSASSQVQSAQTRGLEATPDRYAGPLSSAETSPASTSSHSAGKRDLSGQREATNGTEHTSQAQIAGRRESSSTGTSPTSSLAKLLGAEPSHRSGHRQGQQRPIARAREMRPPGGARPGLSSSSKRPLSSNGEPAPQVPDPKRTKDLENASSDNALERKQKCHGPETSN